MNKPLENLALHVPTREETIGTITATLDLANDTVQNNRGNQKVARAFLILTSGTSASLLYTDRSGVQHILNTANMAGRYHYGQFWKLRPGASAGPSFKVLW